MAILNFPNTGLVANVTQYTGDNGITYTWDGVKWIGRAAGTISGTTNKLVNVANEVVLEADGSITLPTLTTLDWDRRDLVGPTLQMGNDPTVSDAVITGPAPNQANPNAVRVIIQGQEGFGSNNAGGYEGGDVYVWAGHGGEGNSYSGDGGDVKLRGGVGGLNGGYIRLESGDANAPNGIGGFLDLNAGNAYNTGGVGGVVNIRAGEGLATNGSVNVYTSNGQWQFTPSGDLTLPAGGDILDSNGASVLGGGAGPVQDYLELTQSPFIVRPIVLGTPVTVSSAGDGSGAQVTVVIGAGPVITSITVTNTGSGYIVGQRYRISAGQIGGIDNARDSIEFDVLTVDGSDLDTITNIAFVGAATNSPGTYTGVTIELRASPGDSIGPGLTLVRGRIGALFNILAEAEYNQDTYVSPLGTEWNNDGWGDLVNLQARSYGTFRDALNGNVGGEIIGAELVMHDMINEKYYKFSFSDWGSNNGGSYAYTRTLIEDPNYFVKANYATVNNVDVIEDDSTLQIGITRGNNQGIYNPFTEEGWNSNTSPQGTLWNVDGWDNLTNVETRTYDNFNDAYNSNLGNRVQGSKAVMYVPGIDKYYAIQWIGWQQNAQGGGFSYLRYELDLTQLQRGITFADGTVLVSAEGIGPVKLTAPGERRIEEAHGYKSVSLTSRNTSSIVTTTASQSNSNDTRYVGASVSAPQQAELIAALDGDVDYYFEVSLDESIWYKASYAGWNQTSFTFLLLNGATLTVAGGDTVYYRIITGGDPVVWWSSADLPNGSNSFRGAVIDYHAYTGEATWIGTIHIVDDDGDEHITHTEVSSGDPDSENDDLWIVQNEGTISYRRIDGESKTLKIQWTAKVFYGSELYD